MPRRMALHPPHDHRENGARPAGGACLPDGPRALGALRRKPPHLARTADLRPRRRAKFLGRSGPGPAGTNPGVAIGPSHKSFGNGTAFRGCGKTPIEAVL